MVAHSELKKRPKKQLVNKYASEVAVCRICNNKEIKDQVTQLTAAQCNMEEILEIAQRSDPTLILENIGQHRYHIPGFVTMFSLNKPDEEVSDQQIINMLDKQFKFKVANLEEDVNISSWTQLKRYQLDKQKWQSEMQDRGDEQKQLWCITESIKQLDNQKIAKEILEKATRMYEEIK